MAEIKWVKISTDMFDNRKVKHLRRLPEGNDIALIWVMLLTMAGRCNAGGMIYLTESIPYTADMLADEFGFEESTVVHALKALEELDMIVFIDGFLVIAGWEDHQSTDEMEKIREQNRLRKQKQRERQRRLTPMSRDTYATEEYEQETEMETEAPSFSASAPTEEELYVEKKVSEAGFSGKEADVYREELRENLRLKYLGGELGQDVILMSGEQFDDLCRRLSLDEIDKYFGIVAECEMNGRRYKRKSHYQAILDMAEKDRRVCF